MQTSFNISANVCSVRLPTPHLYSVQVSIFSAIVFPICCVIGLFAKFSNAHFYLCILAVCDSLSIFFSGGSLFFNLIHPSFCFHFNCDFMWAKRTFTWPGCRVTFYITMLSRSISIWVIVTFTLERCTVVLYPLHGSIYCTKKYSRFFVGSIIAASLVANIPAIFGMNSSKIKGTSIIGCRTNQTWTRFNYFLMLILSGIPTVAIFISNVLIIWKLRERTKGKQIKHGSAIEFLEIRVTRRLVLISSFFVVLNLPLFIYTNIRNGIRLRNPHCRALTRMSPWSDGLIVCLILYHLNFCINFILYSLTSRQFRLAVRSLISCSPAALAQARGGLYSYNYNQKYSPNASNVMVHKHSTGFNRSAENARILANHVSLRNRGSKRKRMELKRNTVPPNLDLLRDDYMNGKSFKRIIAADVTDTVMSSDMSSLEGLLSETDTTELARSSSEPVLFCGYDCEDIFCKSQIQRASLGEIDFAPFKIENI